MRPLVMSRKSLLEKVGDDDGGREVGEEEY